jgi:hypothetical protein
MTEPSAPMQTPVKSKKRDREEAGVTRDGWQPGGKNMWRYQAGSDQKVIEILMPHGHITFIDTCEYAKVAPHRWYETDGYAATTMWESAQKKTHKVFLHAHLFPELSFPRNHINWNGLDNRRSNLEDGANGLNQRYRKKERDVYEYDGYYLVQWVPYGETNQKSKSFSWKTTYPSKSAAEVAARAFSRERSQAVMEQIRAHNSEHGPSVPIVKRKRPLVGAKSTGVPGVYIRFEDTDYPSLQTQITINRVIYNGCWPLSQFEDKAAAISFGSAWRTQKLVEHPRLSKKK